MPRARKKPKPDFPATEPVTASEALADSPIAKLIEQHQADRYDETVSEFLADSRRMAGIDGEPDSGRFDRDMNVGSNGQAAESAPGKHAAAVLSSRPKFTAPANFMGVASFPQAGIRVSKSFDRRTVAIQFSDDKPLSRATEYPLMERLQEAGFQYEPGIRAWLREVKPGMELGQNVIEAVELAKEIAAARGEGRGR